MMKLQSFIFFKQFTSLFTLIRRCMAIATAMALLSGCFGQETVKDSLENYQSRLSRVLDAPLPETVVSPLPKLTDGSQFKYNIAGLSINLREFYAIQDCELGRVVAERNTSLGKSQLPSQRLVYESKLLSVFSACENSLREIDTKLADTLAAWKEAKEADYTQSWANLIQTSKELRLGLNSPERLLATENNKDALASINSLYFLDELISPNALGNSINSGELETQLKIILSSRLPASLWQTQHTLATTLPKLTESLTPQLNAIACPEGRASDTAKILRNVFYLFFIEEIQPVGSLINNYHYKLVPLWEKWQQNPVLHSSFKRYINQQANIGFTSYSSAMQDHVSMWQQFLGRCNLSPVA
ncbi:DUF3080 family protein [Alteromonas sp. BMJM2]|uniref:DUF3080 family protein n=1 Tax=Alteromonas sp. BMJM2 TaxID=2954241 RepID=UPI0022B4A767|nr:DUF3080 family protein [Alteromonas sp. BMJM2]